MSHFNYLSIIDFIYTYYYTLLPDKALLILETGFVPKN